MDELNDYGLTFQGARDTSWCVPPAVLVAAWIWPRRSAPPWFPCAKWRFCTLWRAVPSWRGCPSVSCCSKPPRLSSGTLVNLENTEKTSSRSHITISRGQEVNGGAPRVTPLWDRETLSTRPQSIRMSKAVKTSPEISLLLQQYEEFEIKPPWDGGPVDVINAQPQSIRSS